MRALVVAIALAASVAVAAPPVIAGGAGSTDLTTAAKKKKKCKKGFKKSGKKCVRRTITPNSVTLVIAVIKDHRVKFTGYSDFPATTADAFLSGKVVVSDGIGSEKIKFNLFVPKGLNSTNFTADYKLGLNSPNMTVTLVINGVSSNSFAVAN